MTKRLLIGKWFIALRFRNDLCVGVGRASADLRSEADLTRRHGGV